MEYVAEEKLGYLTMYIVKGREEIQDDGSILVIRPCFMVYCNNSDLVYIRSSKDIRTLKKAMKDYKNMLEHHI
jgi:hypothetical protein